MALEQKFVPAANWPSTPFQGPQIVLIDEAGRLGYWSGDAYTSSGITPITPAQLANPTPAMLANSRTLYELSTTKALYRFVAGVATPFSGASAAGALGLDTSAGDMQATVVATATPQWFPMPEGRTRVQVSPTTSGQGVRLAAGRPSVASESADPTVLTPGAAVISAPDGFFIRRSGGVDCTVTLVLGA